MQPPPPGPRLCSPVLHARLQLPSEISNLFLPVKHWAEKWPHPSALTPTKDPKGPGSPATPACRSHSPSASRHTHGLSRNSPALASAPHQALRHAKAQAANVLAPAKGSATEGPTQAFGQQGRPPDITGLAGSEPGLPGQWSALTNSPPLPACTATPKDGPKGPQAQTGSFLSTSDNLTSKRGTKTPT